MINVHILESFVGLRMYSHLSLLHNIDATLYLHDFISFHFALMKIQTSRFF